jgi:hypothetical protein
VLNMQPALFCSCCLFRSPLLFAWCHSAYLDNSAIWDVTLMLSFAVW